MKNFTYPVLAKPVLLLFEESEQLKIEKGNVENIYNNNQLETLKKIHDSKLKEMKNEADKKRIGQKRHDEGFRNQENEAKRQKRKNDEKFRNQVRKADIARRRHKRI